MEPQASSPCLQNSTTNLYLQSRDYSHYYNYFCYYCYHYYSVIVFVFLVNFLTFVHFPSRNSLPTSHIVSLIFISPPYIPLVLPSFFLIFFLVRPHCFLQFPIQLTLCVKTWPLTCSIADHFFITPARTKCYSIRQDTGYCCSKWWCWRAIYASPSGSMWCWLNWSVMDGLV